MTVKLNLTDQLLADLRERVTALNHSRDFAGMNINEFVTMLVIRELQKPESTEG